MPASQKKLYECIGQDRPKNIWKLGNEANMRRCKVFMAKDIENGRMVNLPSMEPIEILQSDYWFAAHMNLKSPRWCWTTAIAAWNSRYCTLQLWGSQKRKRRKESGNSREQRNTASRHWRWIQSGSRSYARTPGRTATELQDFIEKRQKGVKCILEHSEAFDKAQHVFDVWVWVICLSCIWFQ